MRGLMRLLPGLIVLSLSACDNVEWGGLDFDVVPPPPSAMSSAADTASESAATMRELPEGAVLYHVVMAGGRPRMRPVGEIAGDSLRTLAGGAANAAFATRFIADRLRAGSEFTLYHRGTRAGTFVVQEAAPESSGTCEAVPVATGTLELPAGVQASSEYIAIARLFAPDAPRVDVALEPDRRMQILAPILAERLLRARNAPLPGNWQAAMAQLQPFPAAQTRDAGFTATFLVGDTLGPGADNEGHSLFFVATPAQLGYDTAYTRFSNYPQGGKAAPRLVDFLDWNRDDLPELLLEVYGVDGTWFESVGNVNGTWRRTFVDSCRRRPEPATAADTTRAAARPTQTAPAQRRPAAPPVTQPITPPVTQPEEEVPPPDTVPPT